MERFIQNGKQLKRRETGRKAETDQEESGEMSKMNFWSRRKCSCTIERISEGVAPFERQEKIQQPH